MSGTEKLLETATAAGTTTTQTQQQPADAALPENRFELELEFLQALASPAYLHFLATSRSEDGSGPLLSDPHLQQFLRYLRDTYSQPDYARFLQYPHALYFINVLLEQPAVLKEWTLPAFRNFCHQQQFLAWQHRHSVCYGVGKVVPAAQESASSLTDEKNAKVGDAPEPTNMS